MIDTVRNAQRKVWGGTQFLPHATNKGRGPYFIAVPPPFYIVLAAAPNEPWRGTLQPARKVPARAGPANGRPSSLRQGRFSLEIVYGIKKCVGHARAVTVDVDERWMDWIDPRRRHEHHKMPPRTEDACNASDSRRAFRCPGSKPRQSPMSAGGCSSADFCPTCIRRPSFPDYRTLFRGPQLR